MAYSLQMNLQLEACLLLEQPNYKLIHVQTLTSRMFCGYKYMYVQNASESISEYISIFFKFPGEGHALRLRVLQAHLPRPHPTVYPPPPPTQKPVWTRPIILFQCHMPIWTQTWSLPKWSKLTGYHSCNLQSHLRKARNKASLTHSWVYTWQQHDCT